MTCVGNDRLSQFYPVVGVLTEIHLEETGWALVQRHRHSTGRFSECEEERFDSLSHQELLDVIAATLSVLL